MRLLEALFGRKVTGAEVVEMSPGRKIRVDGEKGVIERDLRHSEESGKFVVVLLPNRRHDIIGSTSRRKLRTRGVIH